MTRSLVISALLAACLLASAQGTASAADIPSTTLRVGDRAPDVLPSVWLKGNPIRQLEPGTVYVIEFWATWCPPCRESIRDLSKLQLQYPDVVLIAQHYRDADPATVTQFLSEVVPDATCRFAVDDAVPGQQGFRVSSAWMTAADQSSVPYAFVVNKDGRIAWSGRPSELGHILAAIVAGRFDANEYLMRDSAAAMRRAARRTLEITASQGPRQHLQAIDQLLTTQLAPGETRRLGLQKYQLLYAEGDQEAAVSWARELLTAWSDPESLDDLARTMTVTTNRPWSRDVLDVALKAATQARTLNDNTDPRFLRTAAWVCHIKGDVVEATKLQEKALELVKKQKDNDSDTLKRYKRRKT